MLAALKIVLQILVALPECIRLATTVWQSVQATKAKKAAEAKIDAEHAKLRETGRPSEDAWK